MPWPEPSPVVAPLAAGGCAREGDAAGAWDLWRAPRRDRGAPDAPVHPGKRTCTGGLVCNGHIRTAADRINDCPLNVEPATFCGCP